MPDDMVVVCGQEAESGLVRMEKSDHECSSDTWSKFDSERREIISLNKYTLEDEGMYVEREECGIPNPDELKEPDQPDVTYVNTPNDPNLTEQRRQVFELHRRSRNDSIDSMDEGFRTQIQRQFQGDYECMSSPDSFSTSSSNRSSNTSSLHGNYSPDSISLASFAVRFNFGRYEGSKRCSQVSTASQDSRRQSWEKARDSPDPSDNGNTNFTRRTSSDHTYENTYSQTQESLVKSSRRNTGSMEDEMPPPLPVRKCQPTSDASKASDVELILPYKVVDLEELQKSLDDIEPYYIHDGLDSGDTDIYNECVDPKKPEQTAVRQDEDIRPVLPPKRRSHCKADSTCSSPPTLTSPQPQEDRQTPLPRQSALLDNIVTGPVTKQDDESTVVNEETAVNGSARSGGRLTRQKSLPIGQVTRSRRSSTSPNRTLRPNRSAPPPPLSQSTSPNEKNSCLRPVSEMIVKPRRSNSSSPQPLKRSLTISVLQSPFSRIPVENVSERKRNSCAQVLTVEPTFDTSSIGLAEDEKSVQGRDDTAKSGLSRASAFFGKSNVFKKALISLKKPGTKKHAAKDLVISPPTNFASLYQSRVTVDYADRERKAVSFVDNGELNETKFTGTKPASEETEPEPEDQTGLADQGDEQVYSNFPISQAVDSPEQNLSPQKPPRRFSSKDSRNIAGHDGYLEPCTSERTKHREDEISQNKLPELGPLPDPPAEPRSPVSANLSITLPGEKDGKGEESNTERSPHGENAKAKKPAVKAKPAVPRRPQSLKLKRKPQNKVTVQINEKPKHSAGSASLGRTPAQSLLQPVERNSNRRRTTLEETAGRSRSCELLSVGEMRDTYLTGMHLTVLKDILLSWRNLLRKPVISLAGACWEDFEVVEVDMWPKFSDVHGCILQPVQLKKSYVNQDSPSYSAKFIAKVKSQTQSNNGTKSCYDQDYSVCTSVDLHENISRVLAYFRGDICVPCQENGRSQIHTTISISDQVPAATCKEFVTQSVESHHKDPHSYERTVCLLMLQCARGLSHLHDAGFTHGNLTLSNMFLINHSKDIQLYLANFGKSQPLPKERQGSTSHCRSNDQPKPSSVRNDLIASSEILLGMLHKKLNGSDQNGNLVGDPKFRTSPLFGFLEKASSRLREGTASLQQVVGFLQALLWGPSKLGESVVILSESRMQQWIDRQRSEFIAKLAMDEALSRARKGDNQSRFSMEDLLLCEYLTDACPHSLIRTEKSWFFDG